MVKHTQAIRRLPTNCLSVFDDFVIMALKGLKRSFFVVMFNLIVVKNFQFVTGI